MIIVYYDNIAHTFVDAGEWDKFDKCQKWYKDVDSYLSHLYRKGDKPAIEYGDGEKIWVSNGKYHRETGPAIIRPDGSKEWWLNDVSYSKEEFNSIMRPKKLKKMLK